MFVINLFAALALLAAPGAAPDAVIGQWSNAKGTVEVRTHRCGANLCGRVVRASPKQEAAARKAGTASLVGTELLKNYRQERDGTWTGRVFIPKIGRDVPSQIKQTSNDTLTISGCMLGGLLCKTQVWHRVP